MTASMEKYNTKNILILFKLNRALKARKRVIIELSTMDKSKGISNIVGTGITMENLKEDWTVDVEIKGGKLYICGDLCYDISNAINEMLPDGKMYPSFMGFSEEYLDVSYTVKYAGIAKQTITKKDDVTTTTKKGDVTTTTKKGDVTTTTKKPDGGNKTTTTEASGDDVTTTTGDGQTTTLGSDPSGTSSEVPGTDPTQETGDSNTDASDNTPTESGVANNTTGTSDGDQTTGSTDKEPTSALPIILIVGAVVVAGAVVAFVLIKRKKS